jgi:hypothetical protein
MVVNTLALSTEVTLFRLSLAASKAILAIRCISDRL